MPRGARMILKDASQINAKHFVEGRDYEVLEDRGEILLLRAEDGVPSMMSAWRFDA